MKLQYTQSSITDKKEKIETPYTPPSSAKSQSTLLRGTSSPFRLCFFVTSTLHFHPINIGQGCPACFGTNHYCTEGKTLSIQTCLDNTQHCKNKPKNKQMKKDGIKICGRERWVRILLRAVAPLRGRGLRSRKSMAVSPTAGEKNPKTSKNSTGRWTDGRLCPLFVGLNRWSTYVHLSRRHLASHGCRLGSDSPCSVQHQTYRRVQVELTLRDENEYM